MVSVIVSIWATLKISIDWLIDWLIDWDEVLVLLEAETLKPRRQLCWVHTVDSQQLCVCVCKTREVMQENATLSGRLSTAQSQLDIADSEQKSHRETIMRLMNDQQNIAQFNMEMDNLRVVCIPRDFHAPQQQWRVAGHIPPGAVRRGRGAQRGCGNFCDTKYTKILRAMLKLRLRLHCRRLQRSLDP